MRLSRRSVVKDRAHQGPAVMFVFAWALWLHRWGPALLALLFVLWLVLHGRLEAGLGEALRLRWRRVWPPRPAVLAVLLVASALTFALWAAPLTVKVLPVALDALALSMLLFDAGRRAVVARWPAARGAPAPAGEASDALGAAARPLKG